MTQLVYSTEELFSEHDFAAPQVVEGQRLHGGFLADGTYQPPRALGRSEALDAWTEALRARGGELFDADASLLTGPRVPNLAQHRILLRAGIGQAFWNMLTVTGKIEAKGRLLADVTFPDLSDVVAEDISEMAIGHLGRGLLVAHGLDEGGLPDEGIGGHDVMWFVARDLAFGAGAHPDVDPPESIGRPETGERSMPELPPEIEGLLSFLMNLLLIEFRAEIGFALSQEVLRTPGLFPDREDEAELAAELIERIRTDELVHVRSLRLYLGELRAVPLRTVDGGTVAGAEVIDRAWAGLVRWATVEQPALVADQQRRTLDDLVAGHPDATALRTELDAAADPGVVPLAS
ncbi:hypothetical protein PO878_07770 [Iamia majanohamensis]|uniref:Ferritin-like domain-containing protein n=1 Tax=Iamia majanohamensis TaxID=467976 RepID=A0AAE9Y8D2_9ACTN|nr:hypothetical protein [Iamia majanohamensis]WCO68625.1 hypothetical protein PO878_07770 [Iamia majanohamensis]